MQALGQALEPVAHGVPEADGREGVARGSDADAATARHSQAGTAHSNLSKAQPAPHPAQH